MKEIEELERLWIEHRELMPLLPILEYSYLEVLEKLEFCAHLNEKLLSEVVEYSLSFPSRHWALSAVSWIENGFPINNLICEKLLEISGNKSESQQLRHKSFTQARRWQRASGA